jgi:hypothetical protein
VKPLRVKLHAGKTAPTPGRRHVYAYAVELDGLLIVEGSHDPATDLARALLDRGLKGKVEVLDGKTGKPRYTVDIERAAKLRTVDTDRDGIPSEVTLPEAA